MGRRFYPTMYTRTHPQICIYKKQSRYTWQPPHVGSAYKMEQLPEAVRALQSGQTVGKVVVQVDDFEAGAGGVE